MDKEELIKKIQEIKESCIGVETYDKGQIDYERSHNKIDKLLWEYIGFTDEEITLVSDLCPWTS